MSAIWAGLPAFVPKSAMFPKRGGISQFERFGAVGAYVGVSDESGLPSPGIGGTGPLLPGS